MSAGNVFQATGSAMKNACSPTLVQTSGTQLFNFFPERRPGGIILRLTGCMALSI